MTMLEELKYCASAYSSFPRLGELCARAAAEIDKLDKEVRELRRQNAALREALLALRRAPNSTVAREMCDKALAAQPKEARSE